MPFILDRVHCVEQVVGLVLEVLHVKKDLGSSSAQGKDAAQPFGAPQLRELLRTGRRYRNHLEQYELLAQALREFVEKGELEQESLEGLIHQCWSKRANLTLVRVTIWRQRSRDGENGDGGTSRQHMGSCLRKLSRLQKHDLNNQEFSAVATRSIIVLSST